MVSPSSRDQARAPKPTASAPSMFKPTATGERRPNAPGRISASVTTECRCRSFERSASSNSQSAQTNRELGLLDRRRATAIVRAAREVIDGKLDDHFPLVVWQTGSGTQTNMNLNEVIANRANELLGGKLGAKKPVHPNDHVNMSQSSNDSFPTAMHIAAAMRIAADLIPALSELAPRAAQERKGVRPYRQDRPNPHPGRYAADARPGILRLCGAGRERHRAAAHGDQGPLPAGARRHRRRHRTELEAEICEAVCEDTPRKITRLPFTSARNKFEALASNDAYVFAHGAINSVATGLFKIANDIRLLGSGRVPASEN